MRKLLILLSLTTVFLVGTAAMEAIPTVSVIVNVKDSEGKAVSDAEVIMNGVMALMTDSEGNVLFPRVVVGSELNFTITKIGYTKCTIEGYVVKPGENVLPVTIHSVSDVV